MCLRPASEPRLPVAAGSPEDEPVPTGMGRPRVTELRKGGSAKVAYSYGHAASVNTDAAAFFRYGAISGPLPTTAHGDTTVCEKAAPTFPCERA